MAQKKKHIIKKQYLLPFVDAISVFLASFFAVSIAEGSFDVIRLPWGIWTLVNYVLLFTVYMLVRLYTFSFSSVSILELIKMICANVFLLLSNLIFAVIAGDSCGITVGAVFLYIGFVAMLTGVSRISKRFIRALRSLARRYESGRRRVMIVGGGESGTAIIREILNTDKAAYNPVCIADDNPELKGKYIFGVKVVSDTYNIPAAVERYGIQEIFVTMPGVNPKTVSEIIERCNATGLPIKVFPGIYQLADGTVSVSKLRNVEIGDLLGREAVTVKLDEIIDFIAGKTVLVTGGGGSIGSELCRQIATHNPKQLIILDIYENNAYDIEQELKRKYPDLNLVTLIASIRDERKINTVFEKYRPEIVFNAAAHKHVPLMETSPCEAVKNNCFGTLNVARAADAYGAETFVQISTDKAVNPTNIMGASKRICEMIVQTIGKHSKNTNFALVRFGNVLGSNGSVIPLFKKQIAEGGPVTVTHKDIIRYFMTIPEAVALVLQAGSYAKDGQIFVLDMGEPVKIDTLARNLIRFSGLKPDVDIEIVYTGLRPGEKLYEERLMDEEGLQETENGLISIAKPIPLDEDVFWDSLERLGAAARAESCEMKELVRELVPTYVVDKCCEASPEREVETV